MACGKEDISIEKNTDTSWTVDKKITEDDIRTRLGYDPRFQYLSTKNTEVVIPMLSLEGFTIEGENTRQVEVALSKTTTKDTKVTLQYDASLFEKIKSNYSEYSLGEASLVQIAIAEKTIVAGETSATFELKVSNQANFNQKLIVPFTFKISDNENVKVQEGKDYVVVKIYPQGITFGLDESNITKEAVLENGTAKMPNKDVELDVSISNAIPSDISLGLVRDNSLLPSGKTIAPDGIEGTITPIDFKNKTEGVISFTLQNIEQLTTEGEYVLPLKLMAYNAAGTAYQVLETPVLVTIKISKEGVPEENSVKRIRNYSGDLINSSKYNFYTNYQEGHIGKMHDGNYGGNPWWIDTKIEEDDNKPYVQVVFTERTKIKGIKITQRTSNKRIEEMQIYAKSGDSWLPQGIYTSTGSNPTTLYLEFEKPITTEQLYLAYFKNSQDQYIDIHEMEFF
ncbi:MAG: DUF1735 domain-containing protein [Capnocytophaga sp.]|nr:DUF1735 domain-containing protein [Capnocytophaga sp.]